MTEQNSAIKPTASAFRLPMLPRDELLSIEGIDPTTEMALNSIGIRKFTDFRGYTAETLAQALQERTGMAIAATTIAKHDWIGGAELLVNEAEKEKMVEAPLASTTWRDEKPLAAPANPAATISPEEQELTTAAEAHDEIVLSIMQARFQQFEGPTTANAAATKFLRSEIDCCVAAAEALRLLTDRVPLCMQIFAVDTATDEYKLMASHWEDLLPEQADYRFQLEFAAPPVGRYHLKIVAFLLAANPRIAFHPGPILRVVT